MNENISVLWLYQNFIWCLILCFECHKINVVQWFTTSAEIFILMLLKTILWHCKSLEMFTNIFCSFVSFGEHSRGFWNWCWTTTGPWSNYHKTQAQLWWFLLGAKDVSCCVTLTRSSNCENVSNAEACLKLQTILYKSPCKETRGGAVECACSSQNYLLNSDLEYMYALSKQVPAALVAISPMQLEDMSSC